MLFCNHSWNLALNSDCVFTLCNVGQEKKLNDDIVLLTVASPRSLHGPY